jgi:hypothetical protein
MNVNLSYHDLVKQVLLSASTEGATQVVNPIMLNFPGYEVTAAVVNSDITWLYQRER